MSKLTELAFVDVKENMGEATQSQHQAKHIITHAMRKSQEDHRILTNIIGSLSGDKDDAVRAKAVESLTQILEENRKLYEDLAKLAGHNDNAIACMSRADRWAMAISEELKA